MTRVFVPDSGPQDSRWELRNSWTSCHRGKKAASRSMSKHINKNEQTWQHCADRYFGKAQEPPSIAAQMQEEGLHEVTLAAMIITQMSLCLLECL